MIEETKARGQALCDKAEADGAKELARRLEATKQENEALLLQRENDALAEAEAMKQEAALRKKIAEKMVIRGLEDKCR